MAQHGGSVVDMQRTLLERLCGLRLSITDEADGKAVGGMRGLGQGKGGLVCVYFSANMLGAVQSRGSCFAP